MTDFSVLVMEKSAMVIKPSCNDGSDEDQINDKVKKCETVVQLSKCFKHVYITHFSTQTKQNFD